jgi:hypothetical protein
MLLVDGGGAKLVLARKAEGQRKFDVKFEMSRRFKEGLYA